MDEIPEEADEGVMILSPEAHSLWEQAKAVARDCAKVSPHRRGAALPPLLFLTDPERTPEPWRTAERLPPGSGVVYRHFGAENRTETARRLRQITRDRGLILLIGLDAELAQTVGADGVHLPERARNQATALRQARPDWIITSAAHDLADSGGLAALDALILSPVFPAGGASAARQALGLERFSQLAQQSPLPVYALGGIDTDNAVRLGDSGACGLAGVSAIQQAFAD